MIIDARTVPQGTIVETEVCIIGAGAAGNWFFHSATAQYGLRKLTEDGVVFRSHIDGSEHRLSPERSMEIQRMLDSNITMVLDECTPHPSTHAQTDKSLALSMRWAQRSKDAFVKRPGYGLVGTGTFPT